MENWVKILFLFTRLFESVLDFLKHPFEKGKHPHRHKGGKRDDE